MGSANPIAAIAGPVLGTVGGLISGGKAADAAKGQAEALRAAADKASAMAQFNPYGMTTAFGTSTFEDGRGSYTLSPQLQALQSRLFSQLGYGPQTTTQQVPQLPEGYSLTAPQAGLGTAYTAVQPKTGFTYAYSPTGERIEVPLVSQSTTSQGGQGYSPEEFTKQIAPISGGASSLFGLGQQILPSQYNTASSPQAQALAAQYQQAQQGLMPTSYQAQATPEALAYANQLRQTGQSYLAQSPEEARAEYIRTQQAVLAPGRAAEEARLAAANFGRGTGGLGVQTGTGTAPSNPLAQAMYNARAQQDLQLAAQAENAAQQRQTLGLNMLGQGYSTQATSEQVARQNLLGNLQASLGYGTTGYQTGEQGTELARARAAEDIRLGAGLFGTGGELLRQIPSLTTAGYAPLEAQLGLLGTTEKLGQQPFLLSQELAGRYAQAGANAGQLYLQPQQAAATAYNQYQGYSPMGSTLSAIGSTISPGGAGGSWFSNLLSGGSGRSEGYSGMNAELGLG